MSETVTLTQEQLDSIVAGSINKYIEAQKESEKKEQEKEIKQVSEEAKEKLEAEKEEQASRAELEQAIKFNMDIKKFVDDNAAILPPESKKILETIDGKKYASEKDKANEVRKGLIDSFIALKDNIDILPATQKAQVEKYKNLTEDEKLKQAPYFWGIVDVGTNNKVLMRRANQQNQAGGSDDAFEKRFLETAKNKFKRSK